MNDEQKAVIKVLRGTHPGNYVDGARNFSPVTQNENFKLFIEEDIPRDWHIFRRLCWLMWSSAYVEGD